MAYPEPPLAHGSPYRELPVGVEGVRGGLMQGAHRHSRNGTIGCNLNRAVKEKSGKGGVATPTNPLGSLPVANKPVLGQKVTSVKKKSKSGSSKVVPRQSSSTQDDSHLSEGEIVEDPDRLGNETAEELFESSEDGSDRQTNTHQPRSAPQSEPSTDDEPRQARIRKRSPLEDELETEEIPAPKVKKVRTVQAAPVTQAISVNQLYNS